MKLLKICNVKNIYEARTLGERGVDFVGLHLISESDWQRSAELKSIIRLYHQQHPHTKTIIVTKEKDIGKLADIVNDFECDGLQLHYPAQPEIFAKLRALFGERILLFGVTAANVPQDQATFERADYVIIDKNFRGGTGRQIDTPTLRWLLRKYNKCNVLVAGGVDDAFIRETQYEHGFVGYDTQSAVRSDYPTEYENISFKKATKLLDAAEKPAMAQSSMQIGLSASNEDDLASFCGVCDFWHFDFFDNIFGLRTNTTSQLQTMRRHAKLNSHFTFQVHIFTKSEAYAARIIAAAKKLPLKSLECYVHLSPETLSTLPHDDAYASLDIKRIITGQFPLRKSLKRKKVLLCLQSEKHTERGVNANVAINLIHEFWGQQPTITLDRGITPSDINNSLHTRVNIVSGKYLHTHRQEGYNELIRSLHNVL